MSNQTVDVKDFGASGRLLITKGTIVFKSQNLTVQDTTDWEVGMTIAVERAGQYRNSLVTSITQINGNTLILADPAVYSVKDTRVTSVPDDRPAIQRAIDSLGEEGGTVIFPAGEFIIGTKGSANNQPIKVGSNISLVGAGIGKTIVRLADDVKQIPTAPDQLKSFNAALIVNKGNRRWFGGFALGTQTPAPDPDSRIEIANMTIDGNKDGQSIFIKGNRTANVPDPIRGLNIKAAEKGGSLDPNKTYAFCVTYADPNDPSPDPNDPFLYPSETAATNRIDTGTLSATACTLLLPFKPAPNVQQMFVYVADTSINDGTPGGNLLFDRQGPLPVPNNPPPTGLLFSGTVDVTSFTQPTTNDPHKYLPPGSGAHGVFGLGLVRGPGQPTRGPGLGSAGIYFDQVSQVRMCHVEIKNSVLDGLTLSGGFESFVSSAGNRSDGHLHDCEFDHLWIHDNDQWGIDIQTQEGLQGAKSIVFRNCSIENNSAALDVEDAVSCQDILFHGCSFKNNGISIGLKRSLDGLALTNCEFIGSPELGIGATAIFTRTQSDAQLTNCRIIGCVFRDLGGTPIAIALGGDGLIMGCDFYNNGITPTFDDNGTVRRIFIEGFAPVSQLHFNNPPSSCTWRVIGNRFEAADRPQAPDDYQPPAIVASGPNAKLAIIGNHYKANPANNHFFVGLGEGTSDPSLPSAHIIHSNIGDGFVFNQNVNPVENFDVSPGVPVTLGGPTTRERRRDVSGNSVTITLPQPLADLPYQVAVSPHWDAGNWFITKKADGFIINWTKEPSGSDVATLDWTLYL